MAQFPWNAVNGQTVGGGLLAGLPEGASQTYLLTVGQSVEVAERDGAFLLYPVDDLVQSALEAFVTEFTLLTPDSSGNQRLRVITRRVHHETGRPVVDVPRESVYRLEPEVPVLEEGTSTRFDHLHAMAVEWLYWGPFLDDGYGGVLEPETEWITALPALQSQFASQGITIIGHGTLSEWIGTDESEERTAVVTVSGQSDVSEDLAGGLAVEGQVSFFGTLHAAPLGFPEQIQRTVELSLDIGLSSEDGYLPGTLRLVGQQEFRMSRLDQIPKASAHPVEIGMNVSSQLNFAEWDLGNGTPADVYVFNGIAQEMVRVTVDTEDFPAYVALIDSDGAILAEHVASAGSESSRLERILPRTGSYYIVVGTLAAGSEANYNLAMHSLGRQVDAESLRDRLRLAVEAINRAAEEAEWTDVVEALEKTVADLRLMLPFRVREARLVAERPRIYGEYVVRSTRVYRPGETVQIYLEPENFHTRLVGDRYEYHFTVDATLLDVQGRAVSRFPDAVVWNRLTVRPINDIFLAVPLWVQDLPTGQYTWQLVVRDVVSGQSATVEVPIVIMNPSRSTFSAEFEAN